MSAMPASQLPADTLRQLINEKSAQEFHGELKEEIEHRLENDDAIGAI